MFETATEADGTRIVTTVSLRNLRTFIDLLCDAYGYPHSPVERAFTRHFTDVCSFTATCDVVAPVDVIRPLVAQVVGVRPPAGGGMYSPGMKRPREVEAPIDVEFAVAPSVAIGTVQVIETAPMDGDDVTSVITASSDGSASVSSDSSASVVPEAIAIPPRSIMLGLGNIDRATNEAKCLVVTIRNMTVQDALDDLSENCDEILRGARFFYPTMTQICVKYSIMLRTHHANFITVRDSDFDVACYMHAPFVVYVHRADHVTSFTRVFSAHDTISDVQTHAMALVHDGYKIVGTSLTAGAVEFDPLPANISLRAIPFESLELHVTVEEA